MKVPGDVLVLPERDGRWIVMNVFARSCLGVETAALAVLRAAESGTLEELMVKLGHEKYRVWDIYYFSNQEGLLADPTRYVRDVKAWGEGKSVGVEDLIKAFKKYSLLIDDETRYRARFGSKKNLLDGEHFGTFHQQLGQHLATSLRQSPGQWWVRQKFNEQGTAVLNNLYGAIQGEYLKSYFCRKFPAGSRVVDVGCGTGYYSQLIAAAGANVVGVDPNAEYIQKARSRQQSGARFETAPIGTAGA